MSGGFEINNLHEAGSDDERTSEGLVSDASDDNVAAGFTIVAARHHAR